MADKNTGIHKSKPKDDSNGHRKRLREQAASKGLHSLREREVVELLLHHVIPRCDTRVTSEELLQRFGNLYGIINAPTGERLKVHGFGKRSEEFFNLLRMFADVYARSQYDALPVLDTPELLGGFCTALLQNEPRECLYVLCLDVQHKLCRKEALIARGTVTTLDVAQRDIVELIAGTNTVSVVLCHNHPGGLPMPSEEDVSFTRDVRDTLSRIGVNLYDHIIVGSGISASMRASSIL